MSIYILCVDIINIIDIFNFLRYICKTRKKQ